MRDRIHTEEFKVRLTEDDADLLQAIARKRGIPPAVIMRAWIRSELHAMSHTIPVQPENRSRA